jgi:hypothetical protein
MHKHVVAHLTKNMRIGILLIIGILISTNIQAQESEKKPDD